MRACRRDRWRSPRDQRGQDGTGDLPERAGTLPHGRSGPGGRGGRRCPFDRPVRWRVGHQVRPPPTDGSAPQRRRVEVHLPAPDAQVEPLAGHRYDVARLHHLAVPDANGGDERVRRPKTVGMAEGDVEGSRDRASERDDSRADGPHDLTGSRGVLDAAVAGRPALRWRPEGVADPSIDRRTVSGAQPCAGWLLTDDRSGRSGDHHEDEDHDGDEPRSESAHDRAPVRPVRAPWPAGGCAGAGRRACGSG